MRPKRDRMTAQEVRRYAHGLAAEWLRAHLSRGAEAYLLETIEPRIVRALEALAEQHERFKPKAGDLQPARPVPRETPLLDGLDVAMSGDR